MWLTHQLLTNWEWWTSYYTHCNMQKKQQLSATFWIMHAIQLAISSKYEQHLTNDGWNVRNCSSSHEQIFRDGWNVKIGDGWNVRNCLNMNFLKLVKIWIWILQNLRCLSCKSTNFVLVVKPTLMSLFWLFGLCLFGLLFAMYDW